MNVFGFLENPVFLLFIIILCGEVLGKIALYNFSLGSSAIIFVALVFGHFGFVLPEAFEMIGLVLFIYTIGLQAGPGILNSFSKEGLKLTAGALFLVSIGFIVTILISYGMGYSQDIAAGIFAGALTSTPGLAVAVELGSGSLVAASYGVCYSFGVIGVILFIRSLPLVLNIDLKKEEQSLQRQLEDSHPKVDYIHVSVQNHNVLGKSIRQIGIRNIAKISITRIRPFKTKEPVLVNADTILKKGDVLRIVGTHAELKKAQMLLGKKVKTALNFEGNLINRKIVVSRKEFVGVTIGSMNIYQTFGVQISRLTRNGIDIPVGPHTRFMLGDRLHAVGQHASVDNLRKHLGNDYKIVYSTNVISIFIGICIGLLIGIIPFSLPGVGSITLGSTGGVLLAGLVLGNLYHTKSLVWCIPDPANALLRHLGLAFFMATVGSNAGSTFLDTIHKFGAGLFVSGMLVTMIPLISGYLFAKHILKLPLFRNLGTLAGGMTSTPGLVSIASMTETTFASSSYATVYPVALISMIVFTKLLMAIL